MEIPFFQIDAFADRPFQGNPAAVCLLEKWLEDDLLQAIAAENNLSETAFLVPAGKDFALRWFTPRVEVDLCGHATLASAFVVFKYLQPERRKVVFQTQSGPLVVVREGEVLTMDFPARPPWPCPAPEGLAEILGLPPVATLKARDLMAVFENQDQIRDLRPDGTALAQLDLFAVIVTAPGRECDFVSRFFAPRVGVPEDPVTGSAHCTLIPYWSRRLGKRVMSAQQLSARGGRLVCRDGGERVFIGGKAVTVITGVFHF